MAKELDPETARLAQELAEVRRQLDDLQPEHRLYRKLFENSLGLMCIHDMQGTLLMVNPAAAASLGYRAGDGVGHSMRMFLAPPVQHMYDEYLDRIRRHGSDSGLMRLRARDGSERIWLYRNALFQDPGAPPRVLGHAQDITDRVRAEEALRESERRFRTMADTAPVMIWISDTDGKCVFVNRSWLDFTGRALEQELGDGWAERFHPDDSAQCVAAYLEVLAKRESFRTECRMRRADGEYRWVLETGAARLDEHWRFAGYVGSCLDITEARENQEALRLARDELALRVAERTAELVETNEALRRSEQHYQVLAELSPVGIFRMDEGGRCRYVNERACALVGLCLEELRKKRRDEIIHAEDRTRVDEAWRSILGGGDPGSMECRLVHRDGSTVWVLVHIAAERGASGEVTGCIGTVADISDRKRAEEERRQLEAQVQHAQRLQSLGLLAGGLAHDFNNLLTIILGNARMALLDLPIGSAALENLAEIETATSRAAELTGQMLAYSGKGQFSLEAVSLSRIASETAQMLQTIISRKIGIECYLPEDLPAVEADPAQMRQVAMNLITNAAEAIGDRAGAIRISTGAIYADRPDLWGAYFDDHLPAGEYVYLEVRDTGSGMDAETQAKIFDPFFTTKFTGRGLGLAAVLGIVRAHRGALRVASQMGQGSTFRLLFPSAGRPEEARVTPAASSAARQGRGTILVVDDEPGVRHVARLILEKSGYTVLTAYDGEEAIRIFGANAGEVTAILLDMTMPVMSGEDALAGLRKIRPAVPVVLCSGYSETEVASRFANQALAGFLKKPYEPAELVDAVRRAIGPRVLR
jgi:two-component system cell cycle sensor histidine kinase/response regulator CckA